MFITRVERNFEAAHSNGPPGGKCFTTHGHSWQVKVEVGMQDKSLDEWGWTIDFAGMKRLIDAYDHKFLNDIPDLDKPSAEHIAMRLWNEVVELGAGRAEYVQISIAEGAGNSLVYTGPDDVIDATFVSNWNSASEGLSIEDDEPAPEPRKSCGPNCRCADGE